MTDEYSEMRFKDPRLGGYLDRTRVEQHLLGAPLTVWIRGAWAQHRQGLDVPPDRNRWIVVLPPGAQLTVSSPRRSFAVVKAVVGSMENGRPLSSNGTLATGLTVELTAAPSGLILQLDWLCETSEVNLAHAAGADLTHSLEDWHSAPLPELVERIRQAVPGSGGRP
ncbi:hypothetical protein [Kitasatospora azatica]|uniref:hypothetical protein n=1 Tax=Kitasatospora azatica TaxID=58347 RepID=UPI00055FBEC5|nr:hypothetical protein [Kitasatospora azatica]